MKLFPFCSSSKFLHTIRLFSSSVHFLLIMVWTLLCSVQPILFAACCTTFTLASLHNGVAWNRRTMVLLEIAAQWCCLQLIILIHISHKVCSFTHELSVYAELSGSLDKAYTDRCRQLPSGAVPDQLKSGPSTTTSARLTPLGSDYNYLCNFHKADCQPRLKSSAYSGFEIRVTFLLG